MGTAPRIASFDEKQGGPARELSFTDVTIRVVNDQVYRVRCAPRHWRHPPACAWAYRREGHRPTYGDAIPIRRDGSEFLRYNVKGSESG